VDKLTGDMNRGQDRMAPTGARYYARGLRQLPDGPKRDGHWVIVVSPDGRTSRQSAQLRQAIYGRAATVPAMVAPSPSWGRHTGPVFYPGFLVPMRDAAGFLNCCRHGRFSSTKS